MADSDFWKAEIHHRSQELCKSNRSFAACRYASSQRENIYLCTNTQSETKQLDTPKMFIYWAYFWGNLNNTMTFPELRWRKFRRKIIVNDTLIINCLCCGENWHPWHWHSAPHWPTVWQLDRSSPLATLHYLPLATPRPPAPPVVWGPKTTQGFKSALRCWCCDAKCSCKTSHFLMSRWWAGHQSHANQKQTIWAGWSQGSGGLVLCMDWIPPPKNKNATVLFNVCDNVKDT